MKKNLTVILLQPEIPGNTGSIGRTCLALDIRLILIKPLGFSLEEKAVRRAGLDYWKDVKYFLYESFEEYIEKESPKVGNMYFFTKNGKYDATEISFPDNSHLIFGPESCGISSHLLERFQDRTIKLPMKNIEIVRSLNLSNAVTAACYLAYK